MTGPTPPPATCPIPWQPNALTPVFYGARTYTTDNGAPTALRVYFPSLDGSVETAPILGGCGRYPLILFAHGHCHPDPNQYLKWIQLASQLARSGYVVVLPQLPSISVHPSAVNHADLATITNALAWMRQGWEHSAVLMPAAATGIAGHSYGALLAARHAQANTVAAYAGISGVWRDWPSGPPPIMSVNRPKLLMWGGTEDSFTELTDAEWTSLSTPKHRAVFAAGLHWDYLPEGQSPCDPNRGPCSLIPSASADLVTMFFAKYLPPELSPHLPDKIPDNLMPPALVLTPQQKFYAGSHLGGMVHMSGVAACKVDLVEDTGGSSGAVVPAVHGLFRLAADQDVRAAGLTPKFSGSTSSNAWVFSQSPQSGKLVPFGSTVSMSMRTGERP